MRTFKFMLLGISTLVAGCTTYRDVKITAVASPPAVIEINDVTVCKKTPCEIIVSCKERTSWGTAHPKKSPYLVVASPLPGDGESQYAQEKHIDACKVQNGDQITFNMRLEKAYPAEKKEISIKSR